MELSKDFVRKVRGLVIFTAFVVLCFWNYDTVFSVLSYLFGILLPFLLGGAMAFVINVPMDFIEDKILFRNKKSKFFLNKWARPISLVITLIILFAVLGFVFLVLVPQIANSFVSIGDSMQRVWPEVEGYVTTIFADKDLIIDFIETIEFNWNEVVQFVLSFIQSGAGSIIDITVSLAFGIISFMTTAIIGLIFAVYILIQKEKLGLQGRKVVFAFFRKGRAEAIIEVAELTNKTFASFLTGQCTEAIIIGVIFVIVLSLLKLPYAILIGVLISFTALIPVFGAFIGCIVGAFLILLVNPYQAIFFIVIFLIIQQIEGNLIYPYVVGSSVGLPSIWVLVAVSLGASLMGVVGMLIFIPITSVLYALFREVVYIKLKKNNIDPKDIEERKIG